MMIPNSPLEDSKMKTLIRMQMLGLLVLLSHRTSAQFTFLTDNRSVGVSGSTNFNPVYGQTNYPSMPFARFSNSVSGGFAGPGIYTLEGSASQVSILTSNAIYVTNSVSVSFDFDGAPNPGETEAEGTCEITFSLEKPTFVTLTGAEFLTGIIGVFTYPQYATISSSYGTISLGPPSQYVQNWTFSFSTVLQPGAYEVNADFGLDFFAAMGDRD